MKQITLHIPEKKYSFFMELVKSLGFVKKVEEESAAKEQLLNELKEAITELKLIEQGKLKARPAKDLLDEL
ncbi:MAG: hypothetical protein ABI855_00135 [Bacteroidota bacterium]